MSLLNYFKKISFKHALLLFFLFASLCLFAEIVHEVLREKEGFFDAAVFNYIRGFTNPGLTKIMIVISLFGSSYIMLPGYALLIIWLLIKKEKHIALYTALTGVSSIVIIFVLKFLFHRARPANSLDGASPTYSFPSGHTTSAFIFYGLLICLIWNYDLQKKHKYIFSILLALLALLVAFSRIYLHKHFASDVAAGFCVGLIWLSIIIWNMKKFKLKQF